MQQQYRPVRAWDRSVRLFHWVNLACVLGLMAIGIVILNAKALGVTDAGKIWLKQWHVWVGYVLVANLTWRIVWGFIGSSTARWRFILPFSSRFVAELRADLQSRRAGKNPTYLGHNPLGRLMVTALILLLSVQALTGITLAATDLYQGPLGSVVAAQVAEAGVDPASLKPYDKTGVDADKYASMRAWRSPVITVHEWVFYLLLGFITVHVLAVVIAEIRERNGLVSAMITGHKMLSGTPVDKHEP